jgi:galactokinase
VIGADIDAAVWFDIRDGLGAGKGIENLHGADVAWARYVAGVMECYRRAVVGKGRVGGLPNMDLAVCSSVPLGSGLSSSASLEVAVATALEGALGAGVAPMERAMLCQRAEHEFAGVPCGIMDQFASVFGVAGNALLIDCREMTCAPVPLPPGKADGGAVVIVANTNVRHTLGESEYSARRAACRSAAAKLGVGSLREAGPSEFEARTLTDEESRCVRHVTGEIRRVLETSAALEEASGTGDWPAALATVGRLMFESHASLRDDYRVSCDELDTLVELARSVPGVYGARMTGGGFGGCIVALAEPGSAPALVERLEGEYPRRHHRRCSVFEVRAADGARVIDVG